MRSFIILLLALCYALPMLSQDVDPGYNPLFYERANITQVVFDSKGNSYYIGDFDRVWEEYKSGIGKRSTNSDPAEDFDLGTGFNGAILKLVMLSNDQLLVIGEFTSYNGQETGPMALLNGDGSLNQDFLKATDITSQSQSPISNVIELSDQQLLVYGSFTAYRGFVTNSVVILNADGSVDQSFSHQDENVLSVSQAAIQGSGKAVIALNRADSQSGLITRLNADGTKDETFNQFDTGTKTVHKVMAQSTDKLLVLADATGGDQPSVV